MPDVPLGSDAVTDSRRGQSELVGFVMIFGVVSLTIAIVGLTGFTGLQSAEEFQRTTTAEQAFTALAGNVDEVVREGAPSRGTEVRVAEARLALEGPGTVTVTADGTHLRTVEARPIVYDSGAGTTLTYHSGALIRADDGNALMFREPRFVLTRTAVLLPVVNTTQPDGGPVGGTRDLTVRARHAGTAVNTTAVTDTVTLNVTTAHPEPWVRYFEAHAGSGPVTSVGVVDGTVVAEVRTDRVQVTVHRVAVSFE